MKKVKKWLSLFLALAMLVSCFSLNAFAAEATVDSNAADTSASNEVATTASSCSHVWNIHIDFIAGKGIYVSNTECKWYAVSNYVCTKCGYTKTVNSYTSQLHVTKLEAASCNGKTQTHRSSCSSCRGTIYSKIACPAGPHTGLCPALPV